MALRSFASMAFVATIQQDRFDIASEVNCGGRRWRQQALVNLGCRRQGAESDEENVKRETSNVMETGQFGFHVTRFTFHASIPEPWVHIRPMHRRMAPGRPTVAHADVARVVDVPDVNLPSGDALTRQLRVTPQAKIDVWLGQQLRIDRTMRVMACRAALAKGRVFENEGARLLAVALRAVFIQTRDGQSGGGLHDVAAVRVMALNAIHPLFRDRMMLRQPELDFRRTMTLEAGRRILAGVDNKLPTPAASGDMETAGAMASFAAGLPALSAASR